MSNYGQDPHGYAASQQPPFSNAPQQGYHHGGVPMNQQGNPAPPANYGPGPYTQQNYQPGPPASQYSGGQNQQWAPPPQGYGPPPGQYHQQGYGPPPGQYQQQGYGPPPGQYQPQGYGPPSGAFQQQGYPPPQGQFQAPGPGYPQGQPQSSPYPQYQAGPPSSQAGPQTGLNRPPGLSPGYSPNDRTQAPPGTFRRNADELRRALSGSKTDRRLLIDNLARLTPSELIDVKAEYPALSEDIKRKSSGPSLHGNLWETLLAIARGPLDQDCTVLEGAIVGLGTDEAAVNDVLLGRSNADIKAITHRYGELFRKNGSPRNLIIDVAKEYSGEAENLFGKIMLAQRPEEWEPIQHAQVTTDAHTIGHSLSKTVLPGTNSTQELQEVTTMRSYNHIRQVAQAYEQIFRRPLLKHLQDKLDGKTVRFHDAKQAVLFTFGHTLDLARQDAASLNEAMEGGGTNHKKLIRRIVMIHWDHSRMANCKQAYQTLYGKSVVQGIKNERLDSDYERLLIACTGERSY